MVKKPGMGVVRLLASRPTGEEQQKLLIRMANIQSQFAPYVYGASWPGLPPLWIRKQGRPRR